MVHAAGAAPAFGLPHAYARRVRAGPQKGKGGMDAAGAPAPGNPSITHPLPVFLPAI